MMKIYKYELKLTDKQVIELPVVRKDILSLQMQEGRVVFWVAVSVSPSLPKEEVEFVIVGTGDKCPDSADYDHIGTVQDGTLVWHVFMN